MTDDASDSRQRQSKRISELEAMIIALIGNIEAGSLESARQCVASARALVEASMDTRRSWPRNWDGGITPLGIFNRAIDNVTSPGESWDGYSPTEQAGWNSIAAWAKSLAANGHQSGRIGALLEAIDRLGNNVAGVRVVKAMLQEIDGAA